MPDNAVINVPKFMDELQAAGLLSLPFSFDASGVTFADTATADQRAAVEAVLAKHDPAPTPPLVTVAVVDLYRRMTDAEYAAMTQGVATQPPRIQGIFNKAVTFRSDAPEWELLQRMAVQLYGPDRASQLLSNSDG